jgi:hypothetical protein
LRYEAAGKMNAVSERGALPVAIHRATSLSNKLAERRTALEIDTAQRLSLPANEAKHDRDILDKKCHNLPAAMRENGTSTVKGRGAKYNATGESQTGDESERGWAKRKLRVYVTMQLAATTKVITWKRSSEVCCSPQMSHCTAMRTANRQAGRAADQFNTNASGRLAQYTRTVVKAVHIRAHIRADRSHPRRGEQGIGNNSRLKWTSGNVAMMVRQKVSSTRTGHPV